jgi:D-apionolactonase
MADQVPQAWAGALSMVLAAGELRDVRVLGYRALDAVYVAVRDTGWNTVPGQVSRFRYRPQGGGFVASWQVRHRAGGIAFDWRGIVAADGEGLVFRMDGTARAEFEANRIGFCLLHPPELAGAGVQVSFPGGKTGTSSFPLHVSPGPVLTGATGLGYQAGPGARLTVAVTGGLLETEDHRNWTEAGWKTYTPPLADPAPRRMRRGEQISQVVRLTGTVRPRAVPARPQDDPIELRVGAPDGVLPTVGVTLAAGTEPELATLSRMRPGVLHTGLWAGGGWPARLALAADRAAQLDSELSVALTGADPGWLADCGTALAALPQPPAAVSVFAAPDGIAPPGAAAVVRRELHRGHPGVPVGGGSILHAAELNRADSRDPDWDFLSFPVTAQAHHTGDGLVMSTILGQEPAIRCALTLAAGRRVVACPVSLRPRDTPFTPPDPEDRADPRESTRFGAAWLCASLITMHAASMIVFLNPLVDGSGVAGPDAAGDLERLMATLAGLAGQPVLRVTTDPRRVAALAVGRPGGRLLLVAASLSPDPVTVRFGGRTWPLPGYGTVIAGD